jgi:hypothetical protein
MSVGVRTPKISVGFGRHLEVERGIASDRAQNVTKREPHTVRLMPPAYVKLYVKRHKNDATGVSDTGDQGGG